MLDEKDLQAIASLIDSKLSPVLGQLDQIDGQLDQIDGRLDQIDGRLDRIETTQAEHTTALNELLDWVDEAQIEVRIPFGKVKEVK